MVEVNSAVPPPPVGSGPQEDDPGTPSSVGEWWQLLRKKGPLALLTSLHVRDIIAVATAIITAAGGWLTAAFLYSEKPSDLVPCRQAEGYPKGEWIVSGRVTQWDDKRYPNGPPESSNRMVFNSATGGTVRTNEKGTIGGTFKIVEGSILTDPVIRIVSEDPTSKEPVPYRSDAYVSVSEDGCILNTENWTDNYDKVHPGAKPQMGSSKAVWAARSYWVRRNPLKIDKQPR